MHLNNQEPKILLPTVMCSFLPQIQQASLKSLEQYFIWTDGHYDMKIGVWSEAMIYILRSSCKTKRSKKITASDSWAECKVSKPEMCRHCLHVACTASQLLEGSVYCLRKNILKIPYYAFFPKSDQKYDYIPFSGGVHNRRFS